MSSSDTNKAQSNLPNGPNILARSVPKRTASARTEGFPVDPAATTGTSVIGNDLAILGEKITIISKNMLQVDGHVLGDVHGKQVVIGKDGSVTGKVYAEKIKVCGGVRGFIRALTVALHESAQVDGGIIHQTLSISKGAEFDGCVQRTQDKDDLIPVLDAEAFEIRSGNDPETSICGSTKIIAHGKQEGNKDLARAFYRRANGYGRKGAYDRAIADYTKAIKIDPKHASSYVNRATYYDQKGEYDRAIADYTKAIEIRPYGVVVYLKRGLVYREKGNKEGALADFDKSIENASADFSYPYFLRGLFHYDAGQFDRAIADYDKAIEIEPAFAAFYQSRAEAYAKKGEGDRAVADFDKAAKLIPEGSASFYLLRGNAWALRGEYEKAFAEFNKAIALAPKSALAYRDRGQTYAKMGKTSKAKLDFAKAKELDPRIGVPDLSAAAAETAKKRRDHELRF